MLPILPEEHLSLVSRPEALRGHPDDGGGLSDGAAVDHGLVLWADGGGVVQHQDLPLELVAALRLKRRVDHHHPLPDLRPLDLLQGEARCLAALHLGHGHSLAMNRPRKRQIVSLHYIDLLILDCDWIKVAQRIGSK